LPDNGVQLLGDDGKLGAVSRRGGVIPDTQTFKECSCLTGTQVKRQEEL